MPVALQFIAGAAPPKEPEESQLLEIGKKLLKKKKKIGYLSGVWAEKEDYSTSGEPTDCSDHGGCS